MGFFMFFQQSIQAQNLTNRQKLDRLAQRLTIDWDREYAKAEAKAIEMGWPLEGLERLDENGEPIYNTTNNNVAATTTTTTTLRTSKNVDGEGMKIGLWECCNPGDVPFLTHQDFQSRITIADGTLISNYGRHATHVAGTMIGEPPSGTTSRGMAYKATMDAYGISNHSAEMASAGATTINEVGASGKILVSNHSYGTVGGWYVASALNNTGWTWGGPSAQYIGGGFDSKFGQYNSTASVWDTIAMFASYYLICKSSGNDRSNNPTNGVSTVRNGSGGTFVTYNTAIHPLGDGVYANGFDCAPTYSNAKNIMTVGAVNSAKTISNFSSTGPSDDGRVKPDICGMGVNLTSADTTVTGYYLSSGTSMSSPNVAGSLLLLQELYRDKFKVGDDSLFMRATTLKALAIHTADDVGNPEVDFTYGFGVLDANKAGDLIEEDAWDGGSSNSAIIEDTINSVSEVFEFDVNYTSGDDLVITLVYHDHAADTLVNDLDLRLLQHSSGGTAFPWTLDAANPSNNATRTDNDVDNVEQISYNNLTTGTYTVKVQVEDPDSLYLDEPVPFSLIISGTESSCHSSIQHKFLNLPTGTYTAKELISSQANLVTAGREITYETNGKVVLKPGFHAKAQTSNGSGFFKTTSGTCP